MKYKLLLVLVVVMSNYVNAQEYWNSSVGVGDDGVTELGKYIDFHETSTDTKDYSIRLYSDDNQLKVTGGLTVNKYLLIDDPSYTTNWDRIWQCGFFQSYQRSTAPEPYGWFWGINMGHTSNNPDYRYNGQIAIKNSPTAPTMYFRSTGSTGEGTWAKVLIGTGNQNLLGNFNVDGKITAAEIKVESSGGADFVFEEDYQLKSLEEVELFIQENKHLPEIPSAKQMEENGVDLAEMNKLLLQKVEELTLYLLTEHEANKQQGKIIQKQQELLNQLQLKIQSQE